MEQRLFLTVGLLGRLPSFLPSFLPPFLSSPTKGGRGATRRRVPAVRMSSRSNTRNASTEGWWIVATTVVLVLRAMPPRMATTWSLGVGV